MTPRFHTSGFHTSRFRIAVTLCSVVAGAALGIGIFVLSPTVDRSAGRSSSAAAVQVSFPGLVAPTDEPQLAGLDRLRPAPGQVLRADGPFDDRFALDDTGFDGTAVTGTVRVTSDVSAVLELEVVAGFYDATGDLLGTGRFVHHLVETDAGHAPTPEEHIEFTVSVPAALAGQAVAAAVGVPVLVNE